MLMEVGRAWEGEKEGGIEHRLMGAESVQWRQPYANLTSRKGEMLRLSKREREGLHTVMLNRLGLLTRMRARMGMEPSSGRGVTIWMSTTYWEIKEEGRDEKKWCGRVNEGRKL